MDRVDYTIINDEFDLYAFLKLNEVEVTEEQTKNTFKSLKDDKYFVASGGILTELPFLRVIGVWEKDNTRFALWSDQKVEVCPHISWRYNYLDIGNMKYDELFLTWEPDNEEKKKIKENLLIIKEYRENPVLMKRDLNDAIRIRKAELEKKVVIPEAITIDKVNEEDNFNEKFKTGKFVTGSGIKINGDKAEYGGLTIGVEGININEFYGYPEEAKTDGIDFEVLYVRICEAVEDKLLNKKYIRHTHHYWNDMNSSFKRLKVLDEIKLACGGFSVKIKKVQKNKKTKVFIEGLHIPKRDIDEILRRALYYGSNKEYCSFLKEIKNVPIDALKLIEEGIVIRINELNSENNVEEKVFRWNIKRDGKVYSLYYGKKEFVAKDGYKGLAALKKHGEIIVYKRRGSKNITKWELYNMLSKAFDKKESLEIIELGLEDYKEADKRAKELINEVSKEQRSKIHEGIFLEHGNGWFVQGIKNKYFVARDNKAYFVEPQDKQGKYICMYSPAKVSVPKHDKILSTILALLNDQRISKQVSTLDIKEEVITG